MRWGSPVANKITITNSVTSFARGATSVANILFSTTIPGSTLGSNSALRFTGVMPVLNTVGNALTFRVNYGNNSIITIPITPNIGNSIRSGGGIIEGMIVNTSPSVQLGYAQYGLGPNLAFEGSGNPAFIHGFGYGQSSVNSTTNQTLSVSLQFGADDTINSVMGTLFITESIT